MRRGEHYAACPDYMVGGPGTCRGCVPREAVGESLICGRCFARTRALLEAVPDMLAHLRSLTNPLRAAVYDREPGGGSRLHAPPPVPVEVLDAANFLTTLVWSAGEIAEGRAPIGAMPVPPGAGAAVMHDYAAERVEVILDALPALSGRAEVIPLVDAVAGRPASRDEWTVATIFERWSLREEPWWAAQPCPEPSCGVRAVKVTPPGYPGDETRYECVKCGWVAPDDTDGFWAECFSRREGKAA